MVWRFCLYLAIVARILYTKKRAKIYIRVEATLRVAQRAIEQIGFSFSSGSLFYLSNRHTLAETAEALQQFFLYTIASASEWPDAVRSHSVT